MKSPMKYTFEVGTPTAETVPPTTKPAAALISIETAPGAEQHGAAPYVTANGRVSPVAKYRADRIAAALTATQNMTLNDIRRLAWPAEKQDYRWEMLVALIRSVLHNI